MALESKGCALRGCISSSVLSDIEGCYNWRKAVKFFSPVSEVTYIHAAKLLFFLLLFSHLPVSTRGASSHKTSAYYIEGHR